MKRLSQETVDQCKLINIIEYAHSEGYDVRKMGRQFEFTSHRGSITVEGDGSMWNCFRDITKEGGGGIIQLVMYLKEIEWINAVKELIEYGNIAHDFTELKETYNKKNYKPNEKKEFRPPARNKTYKHIFAYLTQTRGIDKEIVNYYVKRHMLYEDENRNCVFGGFNKEGVMKSASRRGTGTKGEPFKGLVANSDKSYSFSYTTKGTRLLVFEAPIDMLSFQTLKKNFGNPYENKDDHYSALNGMAYIGLINYLKQNPNVNDILFCLDNDKAGVECTAAMINIVNEMAPGKYKMDFMTPQLNDWNDDLLDQIEQAELKKDNCQEDEWAREA